MPESSPHAPRARTSSRTGGLLLIDPPPYPSDTSECVGVGLGSTGIASFRCIAPRRGRGALMRAWRRRSWLCVQDLDRVDVGAFAVGAPRAGKQLPVLHPEVACLLQPGLAQVERAHARVLAGRGAIAAKLPRLHEHVRPVGR